MSHLTAASAGYSSPKTDATRTAASPRLKPHRAGGMRGTNRWARWLSPRCNCGAGRAPLIANGKLPEADSADRTTPRDVQTQGGSFFKKVAEGRSSIATGTISRGKRLRLAVTVDGCHGCDCAGSCARCATRSHPLVTMSQPKP